MTYWDPRVAFLDLALRRLRVHRPVREEGSTVAVLVEAEHEGLPEPVRLMLTFHRGELRTAGGVGGADSDVQIRCQYPAWHDFTFGTLTFSESVERGRLTPDGPTDHVEATIGELDATETREAIERVDLELWEAHMVVLRSGRVARPMMNPDFLLARSFPQHVLEEVRMIYDEWERSSLEPEHGTDDRSWRWPAPGP